MEAVMKEVETCTICGSRDKTPVYSSTLDPVKAASGRVDPYSAHYGINRCNDCGLLLSHPVFPDDRVKQLYELASTTNVVEGEEENVRRTMELYYQLVRPELHGRRRMLDVGCDMGFLLDVGSRDGFEELHGIEPNPTARQVARTVPRSFISEQFYENEEYPEQHFDLITLIHVLDHVFNPRAVLERAWNHLRPGGVLLAVVHNVESLLARVLGERFPVFNLYHHYFFSKRTLRALTEGCGYQVCRVVSTKNCYSLRFFIDKLPGVPASLKRTAGLALGAVGVAGTPLAIPVGNIGVIARRP